MVVDGKVQVGVLTSAHGIDKTQLVEAGVRLAAVGIRGSARLEHDTCRSIQCGVAEESQTGRVGADGGEVGTKGFHCTTHTHIACGTVEVVIYDFCILVSFLCCHGHDSHHCNS